MNGMDVLVRLGIPQGLIATPEIWLSESAEHGFFRFLNTPLSKIIYSGSQNENLPLLDDQSGILKGLTVLEVVSYRDVTKALPPKKRLETTGDEAVPQFSANRTLKLLLTD